MYGRIDRKMAEEIRAKMNQLLEPAVADDYRKEIVSALLGDVLEDVEVASEYPEWNDFDVRFAIGRVLCDRLGIEIN